jgi:tetratricopeptide (TPR) repeat protein
MVSLVNWDELEKLAQQDLREVPEADIQKILNALRILREQQAWQDVLKLQEMFSSMMLTQKLTLGHLRTLRDALEENAIEAARALGLKDTEARYLHDRGQFLHQVGSHEKAIQAFDRSAQLYSELGESFRSVESFYMTALCYRALNQGRKAEEILRRVLQEVGDDPWRAHPLEVMSWIQLDRGNLPEVERLLRESLA